MTVNNLMVSIDEIVALTKRRKQEITQQNILQSDVEVQGILELVKEDAYNGRTETIINGYVSREAKGHLEYIGFQVIYQRRDRGIIFRKLIPVTIISWLAKVKSIR